MPKRQHLRDPLSAVLRTSTAASPPQLPCTCCEVEQATSMVIILLNYVVMGQLPRYVGLRVGGRRLSISTMGIGGPGTANHEPSLHSHLSIHCHPTEKSGTDILHSNIRDCPGHLENPRYIQLSPGQHSKAHQYIAERRDKATFGRRRVTYHKPKL